VRAGALRHAPFLLRSLATILARAGFAPAIADAVGIWTHVAGQPLDRAPSPLALVPAMIHGPGCFVPARGVAAVAEAVSARARAVGVTLRENARVARICVAQGRARGVELASGERIEADVVVSDASGLSTLLELAPVPERRRGALTKLPLQSPGLAAYGLTSTRDGGPYLQFRLAPTHAEAPCRLVVRPAALPSATPSDANPTRIVAPLAHDVAERLGATGQAALLDAILAEPWIRERVASFQELARLVPASWGARHALYRDSMNPVMTAKFMRQGRLPHRVDGVDALYQVGSSTHPGQWVSFCLLSGLYGARAASAWLDA
jgi:phytoene dehydrogenase-like protein